MISVENLFKYFSQKIDNFQKTTKQGSYLFTCPRLETHHKFKGKEPTATFIPGTNKISCFICGFKGTQYDCIRTLEPDKAHMNDAEITDYFIKSMNISMYEELDKYISYNWSLVPIANNGKAAIEKEWTKVEHRDKTSWIKWLNNGLNIGLNCGLSNVLVIDIDYKGLDKLTEEQTKQRAELIKLLDDTATLVQNTPSGGKHYLFILDKDIPQFVDLGGLKIDSRTTNGQIVIAPSVINNNPYVWKNLGAEIKKIPEEIKSKILEIKKVEKSRKVESSTTETNLPESTINESKPQLINNNLEGCCNSQFISLGGALMKMGISNEKIPHVLHYLNQHWLDRPMPISAVDAMIKSLDGYKETTEQTQERQIMDCIKILLVDIGAKDIMENTGLKRDIVDKYLSKLRREGKIVRTQRARYNLKEKIEWTNEQQIQEKEIKYVVPYFNDVANFYHGDIILIGAKTGGGKTTLAMNIVKQLREQNILPCYLSLEAGSRHDKIAESLGLTYRDYLIPQNVFTNALSVEIEPNTFTILDWLYTGEDFAATQAIFKHLNDEMQLKKGLLVVFTQLKEDHNYFAVNLIKSFARFSARLIQDNEKESHFQVDKITDPKGNYTTAIVPCTFDFDTKELKKKELI